MNTKRKRGRFKPVDPKQDFVLLEQEILGWWDANQIPSRYLKRNAKSERRYSFFDGPITANNRMGAHHAWGRFYKDLFHRFRNMQGYRQRFQNGFDGQGLWVEVEVEKELGFGSKRDIEKYGIDRFVNACKTRVHKYADLITEQSKRLGYFMDWDNSYHTMSEANNYAIWNFLKICHKRGWLYKGRDVMPWCARCGTGLSQHEIVTDGYREVTHRSLFVTFPLVDHPGENLLVWTTTPWTIPFNLVATVHPDHEYVKVINKWRTERDEQSTTLWLSANRLDVLKGTYEEVDRVKGKQLVGLRFECPFDDFVANRNAAKQHKVLAWQDVSDDEGTGIVHNAPACGAEDYRIALEHNLTVSDAVDESGIYPAGYGFLSGLTTDAASEQIFEALKQRGRLYRVQNYTHRYPVCWRCDTELIFRLVDEWFISMRDLRAKMMDATKRMRWVPEFGRDRELDWLKNMGDWMISKKRYWGLALPIFECDCGHVEVIGSHAELKRRTVAGWSAFADHSPHRPWLDDIKIECSKCGAKVVRIKDVGNPWLDAGIVPFSTLTSRARSAWYPADWISESFPGQFRNWFYALIAMSVALENQVPAKTVFAYALMRDEKGREMHKSRGTAIWFDEAASKMGVDVMRWIFARQNPPANLNFGYAMGDATRRRVFIPLWNVYTFFTTYANLDGWHPGSRPPQTISQLDRWILSELHSLVVTTTGTLEDWRPRDASLAIEEFCELLSNWYVRRSRRRFWKAGDSRDKNAAYATLYECLTTLVKLLAPFIPFMAEEIHRNLVQDGSSVHLCDWPVADKNRIDHQAMLRMRLTMRLIDMGRKARSQAEVKTRQPLGELKFNLRTADEWRLFSSARLELTELIRDELNVKRVERFDKTESSALKKAAMALNFAKLGPKYGPRTKKIQTVVSAADSEQHAQWIEALEKGSPATVELQPGELVELAYEDVIIKNSPIAGMSVDSEGGYTVAISTTVDDQLRQEGWAREFVHQLQSMRRGQGLLISDRIALQIDAQGQLRDALQKHQIYIGDEVLALKFDWNRAMPPESKALQIGGHTVRVVISKV